MALQTYSFDRRCQQFHFTHLSFDVVLLSGLLPTNIVRLYATKKMFFYSLAVDLERG